ncbi:MULTISPECIES: trypsin-like serine peptidase [Bacillus]|uniref:trypsin-like serine peptidase n=1 Tax=Bacillus TaxID=1386 RepID=UPI0011119600|nr:MULTISPECIES: trypsin-like serine protease [Bacillus]QCY64787.1 trypsin-like serine protease [Bacillus thuringiensis]
MNSKDKSKIINKFEEKSIDNDYLKEESLRPVPSYINKEKGKVMKSEEFSRLNTFKHPGNALWETVCGTDERSQVLNTELYPWGAVCQLIITSDDGRKSLSTGWLNGKGTVITAGHCVYSPTLKKWSKSITVIPGRNGNGKPYGEITSENFSSVKGWIENQDHNYNYGAIILPDQIGDITGYFGFKVYQDSDLIGVKANVSGYPGEKYHTQWFMYDNITTVDERRIYHNIDTTAGQSGSPLWIDTSNNQYYVIGIQSSGGCPNSTIRINEYVYNNLLTWRRRGNKYTI